MVRYLVILESLYDLLNEYAVSYIMLMGAEDLFSWLDLILPLPVTFAYRWAAVALR